MRRRGTVAALVIVGGAITACQSAGLGGSPAPMSPDTLAGAAPAGVIGLLGEPDLRRAEPPAEVWQYRTEACVADIYLVGSGGSARVVYIETRSPDAEAVPAAGCLGAIAAGPDEPSATRG